MRDRHGSWQIHAMNADGSAQRQLTMPPGDNLFPAWSPDGRRILFVSSRGGNRQIYVMDPGGGGLRMLTTPPGENTVPAWSPDGRHVAFVSTRDPGGPQLYVMDAHGSGQTRLTRPDARVFDVRGQAAGGSAPAEVLLRPGVLHPVWSPDSRWIAFVTRVGRAEQQIWLASPEGTRMVRVGTGYAPAWSPDGGRIAFVVARVGDAQIYVIDANGSGLVRLTASGVNILPAWSPDGHRIAFLSSRNGDLGVWIMGADGSAQRRLAGATGDLSMLPVVSWRPR